MSKLLLVVKILLFIFLFSVSAFSYPRFSAYTGDKCSDCHVNPTGGGMRNTYGIKYAKQNLQTDFLRKFNKKTEFDNQLNKNIAIGGDVRIAHIGSEVPNSNSLNTFLTMQGDIYVNAKVNDFISVYVNPGYEAPSNTSHYEVFGMITNLPLNLFFKAGRFTPNYGIKIIEHRAFQRNEILNSPRQTNDGLEIGISPGIFNFNMGLYNGNKNGFYDTDPKRLFVSSADITLNSENNNFNLNIGGSFYNNPYNAFDPITSSVNDANYNSYGGFAKIGILKRIALLGEIDFTERTETNIMKRGLIGFGELNIMIANGLEFRSQYEYFQRNRDINNSRIIRTSLGAVIYPLTGLETEAMYRFVSDDINPNTNEFQFNIHFYF